MAIKISGTTVVDDSRNLVNINSGTIAGIQSGGSVVGAGATTINFIGAGNTFSYNPSTKTLDISIEGGGGIAIQSGGSLIGAGITQLNFIGSGNTFSVSGNTVDISISSGNSVIDKQSFNVGAAGTNLVTLTSPYTAGNVDVYLNGLKLSSGDFTETSANVIGLTTAAVQGDTIDVVSFRTVGSIGDIGLKVQQDSVGIGTSISTLNFVGGASTFFNRGNNILDVYVAQGRINKQTFNVGAAGTNLLTLSKPYETGKIDIYRNGIRLAAADFTETSSTTVGLATSAISGDVIEIQSFAGVVNTTTFSVLDSLKVNGVTTTTNLNVSGIATVSGGIQGIGIYSGGTAIYTGVLTALNFVGSGNTFRVDGNTVDISISGGGGSGVSTTGVTTAAFFANPQYITPSYTLNSPNTNYGVFGPIYVSVGSTITVGVGNTLAIL